jgi:hypothetical protein
LIAQELYSLGVPEINRKTIINQHKYNTISKNNLVAFHLTFTTTVVPFAIEDETKFIKG